MKYAIIAAGQGARLSSEGVLQPKPLVSIGGETLIGRLIRIFQTCEAEEIVIIINNQHTATHSYLQQMQASSLKTPLRLLIQNTPSSMHSFAALAPHLEGNPFVLTTVDTIFREEDFHAYLSTLKQLLQTGKDGLMAVTDYIDDESPLYVETNEEMQIVGFHDQASPNYQWISGGIYGLSPRCLRSLARCLQEGQSRMRNFQRGLIADGCQLEAFPFSKILDVDHANDIIQAEHFLRNLPL